MTTSNGDKPKDNWGKLADTVKEELNTTPLPDLRSSIGVRLITAIL
jgi:hypothetical protein